MIHSFIRSFVRSFVRPLDSSMAWCFCGATVNSKEPVDGIIFAHKPIKINMHNANNNQIRRCYMTILKTRNSYCQNRWLFTKHLIKQMTLTSLLCPFLCSIWWIKFTNICTICSVPMTKFKRPYHYRKCVALDTGSIVGWLCICWCARVMHVKIALYFTANEQTRDTISWSTHSDQFFNWNATLSLFVGLIIKNYSKFFEKRAKIVTSQEMTSLFWLKSPETGLKRHLLHGINFIVSTFIAIKYLM